MAVTREDVTGIVNQSLNDLGYSGNQIPTEGTDTEIEAAWSAIAALPASAKNALLEQIVVILKYRNYGTMFDASKNPIRKFFRDDIKFGGGEEDIYHEIVAPVEGIWAQDFAGLENDSQASDDLAAQVARNLVRYYKYDVKKKFHTTTRPLDIPMSLTEYELKRIFTPDGFARFVDVKMANLMWSAEIALLNRVINDIKTMIENNGAVRVTGIDLNTPAGVTDHVEQLRTLTDAMTMPSDDFNAAGIVTMSDKEDLFLFCTPEYVNRLQTRGYANAFNVEYYRNNNRLVILPYGTNLGVDSNDKPVLAVLIDRRAIVESIRYWEVKPFVVANTDYVNYFLKGQVLAGYNEFFNAVAFSGDAIGDFNPATHSIVDSIDLGTEGAIGVKVTNESVPVTVENTDPIDVNVEGGGVLV